MGMDMTIYMDVFQSLTTSEINQQKRITEKVLACT